jgi:hypothetical protein
VYIAYTYKIWILIVGGSLILASSFAFIYLFFEFGEIKFTNLDGCLATYPPIVPFIRVAIDAPLNIGFSYAFLYVIYRQYKEAGNRCWKERVHNGITTSVLIVLSNVLCMIGNVTHAFKDSDYIFYLVDW